MTKSKNDNDDLLSEVNEIAEQREDNLGTHMYALNACINDSIESLHVIKHAIEEQDREKILDEVEFMQEMAKKMSEYCQVFHESSKHE